MNSLRNRVQLIGHVGAEPEVKSFDNGKIVRFTLATNESYKNAKGEKITQTYWHKIVAKNKTADLIEKYVQKGTEIAVEGKLVNRDYETASGEKKYITEVVMNEFQLFGKKAE